MSKPWFQRAASHIWRTYYRYQRAGKAPETEQKEYSFRLCRQVLDGIPRHYRPFLEGYFSTPWGMDQDFVRTFSTGSGIPENILWSLVSQANRQFFELTGLLEPRAEENAISND